MVLIVPLTKLGQNQCDDTKGNVEGSKPIWIDADTVLKVSQYEEGHRTDTGLALMLSFFRISTSGMRSKPKRSLIS